MSQIPPVPDPENPYRSLTALGSLDERLDVRLDDAEATRQQYLKHEVAVQGLGTLLLVGFIGTTIALGVGIGTNTFAEGLDPLAAVLGVAIVAVMIALLAVGVGLYRLQSWARWPAVGLWGVALVNFPCGTLIGGYALYVLTNGKSRVVLSEEYAEVRRRTPHIKYRSSWLAIVLILVFLASLFGFIVYSA